MINQKLADIKDLLAEHDLEDIISILPIESRTNDINSLLKDIELSFITEIASNCNLQPFIGDIVNVPIETDLKEITKLLQGYSSFENEHELENKIKTKNTLEPDYEVKTTDANKYEFRTCTGKVPQFKNDFQDKKKKQNKTTDCNVDEYIVERIRSEILETNLNINWDDIVGLTDVKKVINEIILWPMLRPDIFTGLRGPPKGLLLFGPPGTGKTMIGKCIASQCKATFFSISASSLTSKWVGEGEKMVRALFFLARESTPSVIFIDEIDSLLSQRSENENEGSRRIKTEFLVQFDGAAVNDNDKILVIGATNRPQEIDEAARRRLTKRIYVPLPEKENRMKMVKQLMKEYSNSIKEEEYEQIAEITNGYSGSDIFNLCREATLEPLREIVDINNFKAEEIRDICLKDFKSALRQIRKSVSQADLKGFVEWNDNFGSMPK